MLELHIHSRKWELSMHIYVLTEYCYDTYSYSGLSPTDSHYFTTEEKARLFAREIGSDVREYAEEADHVTIEKAELKG